MFCFLCCDSKLLVPLQVVSVELVFGQIERLAELDCNLLLLKEDEFIVLHVLLRVGLEVGPQLVQVQAVFVVALLVVEEELAELARPERRPNHAVVQHELVHRQDGDRALPRRVEGQVRRVGGSSSRRVVHVLRVYHDFLQVTILAEVLDRLELFFGGDLGGDADHVDERLLDDPEVGQLFDLLPGEI